MTKIITFIAILICGLISAQTNYETEMNNGLALWQSGKSEEAVVVFEKLASTDKNNWLPNYYAVLINTLSSFETQDKEKVVLLLDAAQKTLDIELSNDNQNPELLLLQGMIYTSWIVLDPIKNGMRYSIMSKDIYAKAAKIAPDNPRVMFLKAEFDMGSAKYFGQDTKPMCEQISKSIPLFESYKLETPFHPNWGLDRAKEKIANCK